ncbi:integral membrane plasmid transfer protein [Streptomyces sp. Tu 6176]|uniref:Pycsar system effector family protein n=1 Tax=Streptomyces sp. Tu 6176 TaxID=1470557 RepID=UPI000451616E|nr:Pycsar system effector family protein [Streptomyces sp. Tu 6176]EYT77992.1 integral membrane plasmid transfer protein [Streptomyces sp. Tu 6176]
MSTPSTLHTATTDTNLADALAAVTTEIGRTDGKASLLLAFNGAVLAGLASLAGRHLPTPTAVLGGLAVAALGTATVLLLLVVRPRLGGSDRASFPHWARLTEHEIRTCMTGDTRAARVRVLSRIALAKFGRLTRAVDCTLAALALLALAALTAPLA